MGIAYIYEVLKKQQHPCFFTSNNRNYSALICTVIRYVFDTLVTEVLCRGVENCLGLVTTLGCFTIHDRARLQARSSLVQRSH